MRKLMLLVTACLSLLFSEAQLTSYSAEHNWKSSKYESEPAVLLADDRKIEFKDNEQGELMQVKTLHRIIRVNDDRGIESFNKLYLPAGEHIKMVSLQARTVSASGKVIEVDPSSVKDFTDEDGSQYKIFAFPGIEKGSTLEYTYVFERDPSLFGVEVFQSGIPVASSKLEIISPSRLVFETRAFNGTPVKQDSSSAGDKRFVTVVSPELTEAREEKYSHISARLYRVEYKLSYNTSRSVNVRVFTWNEFAKRVFSNYTAVSDKDLKKAEGLLKDLKLGKSLTDVQKITVIENYLKKNINVQKDISSEAGESVEQILKSRLANTVGIMRLYGILFDKLSIPFQFVLTGDRSGYTLDKSFENWNNADNPLIYFPGTKKYLAPTRPDFRYPWIVPEWGQTLAVHCKGTSLGEVKTAVAEIKLINLENYSESAHNMESTIRIFPEKDSLLIDVQQIFTGYSASLYRSAFNFAPAEEQKNFMKEMVKFGTNSEHIIDTKLANQDFESYPENKPLTLSARVKANQLMERAGNRILLKIGEVIGQQVEMYQEKPRIFPVEIPYPHILYRRIRLEIPEGYAVKNPDDLNIVQSFPAGDKPSMKFESAYRKENNMIEITIREEYQQTEYNIDQFEPFKKVINAAADFNKIVLVLEKI